MNSSSIPEKEIKESHNHGHLLGMRISPLMMEGISKKTIRVILHCLPNAIRGTIYTVGPIPHLRVVRVVSGEKEGRTDEISWGFKNHSDYDPPGKVWQEYRDRPGGFLEAMAWCVEKQKSWTSNDPEKNSRSVRRQLERKAGDGYHHMEPVLQEKTNTYSILPLPSIYPKGSTGDPIWQYSQYATVAVVKIHFLPGTGRCADRSMRVIRELSQVLGNEMLSLHAREIAREKERRLVVERQETCNAIAHDFRNILARIRFAYRAVNNEISYLRHSWESLIQQELPELPARQIILEKLDKLLHCVAARCDSSDVGDEISRLGRHQNQLAESCLLPDQNEIWLREKIRPLWRAIFSNLSVEPSVIAEVENLLERLRDSFYLGLSDEIIDQIDQLPAELRREWVELAYQEINGGNGTRGTLVNQYIAFLDNKELRIPRQTYSKRNFTYLKGLIELIPEIETKLNNGLEALKQTAQTPVLNLADGGTTIKVSRPESDDG